LWRLGLGVVLPIALLSRNGSVHCFMKINTAKKKRTTVQPDGETFGFTAGQLELISKQLLLCTPTTCTHQFYVCLRVGEYQLKRFQLDHTHPLPCSVCRPSFDYLKDEKIYHMTARFAPQDEPYGKPLLVCKSCHDVLCPHAGCSHVAPLPTQFIN
jgi:hypothetical protein